MTAKEYLSQAYRIDQRINSKLEKVEALRSLTQKITASFGGEVVSHTRNVTSMEDAILRLMEEEAELSGMINVLIGIRMGIARCINSLPDPDCQLLLENRYLCFQTWEQIAQSMHFSVRWVHTVHSRALRMVDKALREGTHAHDSASKEILESVHSSSQ